jgi:hypothetical protein
MNKTLSFYLLTMVLLYGLPSCSSASKERGKSAQPTILSQPGCQAACVFMTRDAQGHPVVSWVTTDSAAHNRLYFAYWDLSARKFKAPQAIPIAEPFRIHEQGMPKIAIQGDGHILAIYETTVPSASSKWGISDVRYIQSFDQGKTWTEARSVSKNRRRETSCSFAGLCRLGDGEIGVTWLDTDPDSEAEGRPVLFAKTNGKAGFGMPVLIDPRACPCCRTAVASDPNGRVSIAYRDLAPGDVRDISVSVSTDNGATFQHTVPFSKDHWVIAGCPHNGPSIATRNGNMYVAWFSGGHTSGVHYGELDSSGALVFQQDLSPQGRFIQLCLLPNGTPITAYNEIYKEGPTVYSKIVLNKMDGSSVAEAVASPPQVYASFPVLQAVSDTDVIVAWSQSGTVYYREMNTGTITKRVKKAP